MLKKDFITMILGTIGGLLFALGMCMALLPEWNAFKEGIIMGSVGMLVLLVMILVRRKMEGKDIVAKLSGRAVGAIVLGIIGTLAFGAGMCMVMVWEMMALGIVVGIAGIVVLMCIIPVVKGLK